MAENQMYLAKLCWDKQILLYENWQYDKTCYADVSNLKVMLLIHIIILILLCHYRPVVVV